MDNENSTGSYEELGYHGGGINHPYHQYLASRRSSAEIQQILTHSSDSTGGGGGVGVGGSSSSKKLGGSGGPLNKLFKRRESK